MTDGVRHNNGGQVDLWLLFHGHRPDQTNPAEKVLTGGPPSLLAQCFFYVLETTKHVW